MGWITPLRQFLRYFFFFACLVSVTTSCHVDLTRIETGRPLDLESFEKLEERETTLGETLEVLGAPERVEWKSGKDYLWYLHEDYSRAGIRLQLPIPLFGGYRHNLVQVDGSSDTTDTMELVFDEDEVLERKSLRLSGAFQALSEEEDTGWSLYLLPYGGVSPLLLGDGGEGDFDELFKYGRHVGFDLGLSPAPFFMLLVGGNYQNYRGDDFRSRGARVSVDDLELYQVEIGGRLQFPPAFFVTFWKYEELKTLLYSEDIRRHQGLHFFFKWTLSVTYNEELRARINGQDAGPYFEQDFLLSSAIGGGVEYRKDRFAVFLESTYQAIDRFDRNRNSPLDTDADALQNVLLSGGVSWRF